MTTRPHADPASSTSVAGAGSRRPRAVVLLVSAVLLTAAVQGLLLQSYVVPTGALSPALEPGDRVLVWKASSGAAAGDLVVVDTTATAAVDRSTPVDDGPVGRVLAAVADLLHVDIGRQDRLAVVASASGDTVTLGAPTPGAVGADDVVGRVVLRIWPLTRLGGVDTSGLAAAR
ncbi:S26 family signal peptidase [Oryzobacter telluris]|uniref:S26 family signal peptidase n=1 Tax=Oryzobacter telluris TaxID=3149179 RepID=UPI00370D3A17